MPDFLTKCVQIDGAVNAVSGAANPPIYQSAGFSHPEPNVLEDIFNGRDFGHTYSRVSNPTITELERRITALEGALGTVAVSSGLAAIFAACIALGSDKSSIVVSNSLFGGTRDLFEETIPKLGISVRFVDITNVDMVQAQVDDTTCAIFSEIISNPKLSVPDISALKAIATQHHIPLIVDATLTGSIGFRAKAAKVDVVIYSSTKLFSANGGAIGGLVVDTGAFDWGTFKNQDIQESSKRVHRFAFLERIRRHGLNNIGLNTSPMNAYFTILGIETLGLRYERICQNAQAIAEFFQSANVNVNYPGLASNPCHDMAETYLESGFGPLLTIDLGKKAAAFQFISKLKIVKNMSNLGDNRTMVIHPKSTVYCKHSDVQQLDAGLTDGLIRISVGIESVDDLIHEFKEALS